MARPKRTFSAHVSEVGIGSIDLDGTDISDVSCGFEVVSRVGDRTRIRLDILVDEVNVSADDADLFLPGPARELLIRHGWAPPADAAGDFAEPAEAVTA